MTENASLGNIRVDEATGLVALDEARLFGALYLHVPFCAARCAYCDFETEAVPEGDERIAAYIEDMVLSLRRIMRASLLGNLKTIYLGGGTPTFVGMGPLTQLLYTISLSVHLTDDVECTVEANPDSLTERMVRDLWALGVNRLSIGVQSFDDDELRVLGRIHSADQAREAVATAHQRFENVSIDLMCGIPGQTLQSFERSIQEAIGLGVSHVSVYPLTVEEGTPLALMVEAGAVGGVDEDFQAACMQRASELLEDAGFARYEVASYAKPGFECRHNIAYWTGVPYVGLGNGAVSMVQNGAQRVRFKRDSKGGVDVMDVLGAKQALAEDLMLAMRMTQGASPALVERALTAFPDARTVFDDVCARGLARWEGGWLAPTQRGWLCGNELYGALLDLAP